MAAPGGEGDAGAVVAAVLEILQHVARGGHAVDGDVVAVNHVLHLEQRVHQIVGVRAEVLQLEEVLGCEHACSCRAGGADGERKRRGRPVEQAAGHEREDDVALLDVIEEAVPLERFVE